ncbi:hypothetical protein [Candidatus Poriferisodalis sp.]|uniref:hypothetical protein n=1 Tax=Candidatus Poriferisodalis sp. TaxID=3101277 RepID=UPI003B028950
MASIYLLQMGGIAALATRVIALALLATAVMGAMWYTIRQRSSEAARSAARGEPSGTD